MGRMDEELMAVLAYSPESGLLTWRVGAGTRRQIGDVAGCLNAGDGYWQVGWKGRKYKAHRLAWLLTHGAWPAGEIDHIDGNKLNNRIENLRDVDRTTNQQNIRRARADSATGVLGVHRRSDGRLCAQVQRDGRRVHLGTFEDVEQARAARARYLGEA